MSDSTTFPCGPRCWTPVRCNVCGRRFSPAGRSVPLEATDSYCNKYAPCDPSQRDAIANVHLWDEHDSNRSYTDPLGWLDHVKNCERCS